MTLLSIDVGKVRTGIAVTDEIELISSPLSVVYMKNMADAINQIKNIVQERKPRLIIIGYPYNEDGSISHMCKVVDSFIKELEKEVFVPIKLWDERYTSQQAETLLLEVDLSRKKRKKKIDGIAAAIILDGYMNSVENRNKYSL